MLLFSKIVQQSHRVLLEAGQVCLGDNHCQTIENQRTAIAQLRERLNELEVAKPPGMKSWCLLYVVTILDHAVASHQATLKELSRVRHELMKVRSTLPNTKKSAESPKGKEVKFQVSLANNIIVISKVNRIHGLEFGCVCVAAFGGRWQVW